MEAASVKYNKCVQFLKYLLSLLCLINICTNINHQIPRLDSECSCPFDGVPTFSFLDYINLQVYRSRSLRNIFCFDLHYIEKYWPEFIKCWLKTNSNFMDHIQASNVCRIILKTLTQPIHDRHMTIYFDDCKLSGASLLLSNITFLWKTWEQKYRREAWNNIYPWGSPKYTRIMIFGGGGNCMNFMHILRLSKAMLFTNSWMLMLQQFCAMNYTNLNTSEYPTQR